MGQHFRSCYELPSFLAGQNEHSVIESSQFLTSLVSDMSWHVVRLPVTLNTNKVFVEEPRKKRLLGEHRRLWEDNIETDVERIDCREWRRVKLTRDLMAVSVLTMLIYSWNMNVQIYLVRRSLQTPFLGRVRGVAKSSRLVTSICLSALWLSLDGFSSNFVRGEVTKICRKKTQFRTKSNKNKRHLYLKIYVHLWLLWLIKLWRLVSITIGSNK